jgi:regulator of protease activity HflC (stomatin/prohibitin superfamily)
MQTMARLARPTTPLLSRVTLLHSAPSLGLQRSALLPAARSGTRTFLTIINQGSEGWRLTLGRSPTKLMSGLHLNIPVYHELRTIDMRETSCAISDLTGFTSDNVPVVVSGSLFWRVYDSHKACFSVEDYEKNVKAVGTSAMRSVVGYFSYDEVIGDRNKINAKLYEVIGKGIEDWGISCTRFEIQNVRSFPQPVIVSRELTGLSQFHPSNREVEKQLELQMQAERERRKQILDTQAQVNIAEGSKQKAILASEGASQAELNRANAERTKLVMESEGAREAAVNEGRALAEQVGLLANALAAGEPVTAETRAEALRALVEMRRIEQLQAIAHGPGNSTYFFGDRNAMAGDIWHPDGDKRVRASFSRPDADMT